MRYVVMTIDKLLEVIEDLPEGMKVEIADGVSITATTVRELRRLRNFPSEHERLRIVTPRERRPKSVVKIELVD